MPRRPASITQADVARAIRGVRAAGLYVVRVVATGDGVSIETSEEPAREGDRRPDPLAPQKVVVM